MNRQERDGRVGPVLLVALLVVSLIAGILVYHARTPNLALEAFINDRIVGPAGLPVELEFFVRFDEPDAAVEIVGQGDETVRTLAADSELVKEQRIRCSWDGTNDDGERLPPGNYRLRVVLPGEDRDMVFPQRIRLRQGPSKSSELIVVEEGEPCERVPSGEALE